MEDVAWADAELLVEGTPGILVLNFKQAFSKKLQKLLHCACIENMVKSCAGDERKSKEVIFSPLYFPLESYK